jgi:hypothetical protein
MNSGQILVNPCIKGVEVAPFEDLLLSVLDTTVYVKKCLQKTRSARRSPECAISVPSHFFLHIFHLAPFSVLVLSFWRLANIAQLTFFRFHISYVDGLKFWWTMSTSCTFSCGNKTTNWKVRKKTASIGMATASAS